MCSAHFQDQGHMTFIVFSYIYPAVSENLHFMHIYNKDTWHFLHISCDIRNFMCRVHFHCQGHVTFTVHFLST